MLLRRFYHDGLAQASYMIGCQKTGEALVVDPHREVEEYVAAAAAEGVRITQVSETHIHADFLSGGRELAARTGARLLLSDEGGEEWRYHFAVEDGATLLRGGDSFMVGNVRVDVVHTPGHTPEHLTFVITDTPSSSHPLGAITGDFLFVGDVGRPDLLERAADQEGTMRASAAQLFHSILHFAATYPDHLQLWPGHGSGSACGKALGAVPQTTLGYEKISNWAFQTTNEEQFITTVLKGQPDPPRYFATMKRLNRAGPRLLGAATALTRCAPSDLATVLATNALVLDLRPADVAAHRFIPGTLNLPFNQSFVGWAGWLAEYDRDIYLLTDGDGAQTQNAARELRMIGLDRVRGWFGPDAFEAWGGNGRAFDAIPQVEATELDEWLRKGEASVVDVRAPGEWHAGHISGARHAPLGRLSEALPAMAKGQPLAMQCQGGARSAIAASLAHLHGFKNVVNLHGGYGAWERAGLPVVQDPSSSTV
ncbi:MAG: rhodanese-like domain-containing protein [Gemmatimonadaceae bacterium]